MKLGIYSLLKMVVSLFLDVISLAQMEGYQYLVVQEAEQVQTVEKEE
jgi:hypothetical protein